jgi:hypothetical protein
MLKLKIYNDLLMPVLYAKYLIGEYDHPDLSINGCGPAGILNCLVPDEYHNINITEACNIHDFMYFMGETEQDKDLADRTFLYNILTIFDRDNPSMKESKNRHKRAILYYKSVSELGHHFYIYKGCKKPDYDDALKNVYNETNLDYDWYDEDEHDGG